MGVFGVVLMPDNNREELHTHSWQDAFNISSTFVVDFKN